MKIFRLEVLSKVLRPKSKTLHNFIMHIIYNKEDVNNTEDMMILRDTVKDNLTSKDLLLFDIVSIINHDTGDQIYTEETEDFSILNIE